MTLRKDTGLMTRAGLTNDENGREVLRIVVDFHAGNAPSVTFDAIFKSLPVCIVIADGEDASTK